LQQASFAVLQKGTAATLQYCVQTLYSASRRRDTEGALALSSVAETSIAVLQNESAHSSLILTKWNFLLSQFSDLHNISMLRISVTLQYCNTEH
jgi:hypothetical protein